MSALRTQACERCWRRKQKCSRDIPSCVQCRDALASCVPRGVGPTLDNGEVASETGIEAMKGRIRSMQRRLQIGDQCNSPTKMYRPSPGVNVLHEANTPATQSSLPETLINQSHHEMQDDAAYLSLSAMAERTDNQVMSVGGLSYLTMLYAAFGVSGSDVSSSVHTNEALSGSLAELRQNRMRDADLGSTDLCAAYQGHIDVVIQTFPYMTAAELMDCHDSVIKRPQGHVNAQPLAEHLAIAYLGTATGLLLGSHFKHKEMLATDLALRAVRLLPKILDNSPKLSAIRCLTALVIFSIYGTFGGSTWHWLGLTISRSISAGLHTRRFSNHRSQDSEQQAGSRLLWTLYILDTYVSTSLGRPFSLNDHDILVSPPSSPHSGIDDANAEEATLRTLIQIAQTIRHIRQNPNAEDGILCYYINIHHWTETIPSHTHLSRDRVISLCSRAYIELLQQKVFLNDTERIDIVRKVTGIFGSFLERVEEQLNNPQSGAVPGLEALHILAIGVILVTSLEHQRLGDPQQNMHVQTMISQVQTTLTLFSMQYPVARKYRDIVLELHRIASSMGSTDKLRSLLTVSELAVPVQLQNLILTITSRIDT